MDIYSALSLVPRECEGDDVMRRAGSESTRSILDAIPPPITKFGSKKTQKLVEEEEYGRKKERRKRFWRR